MRYLLFTIGLLAAPSGAFALTWDFDESTTWGWTAQESVLGDDKRNPTTVYSEVEDGVWRIAPVPGGQRPAIQLRSPFMVVPLSCGIIGAKTALKLSCNCPTSLSLA